MISIAVIGAGPSGIAATIQLCRYGFNVTLFEKYKVGGLIRNANLIENLPGFPTGISGIEYSKLIENQLYTHKFDFINQEVMSVTYKAQFFHISTNSSSYTFDIVLVASGTIPIKHELDTIHCKKIKYEIESIIDITHCKVVVIGSGDAAFDYSLNLSRKNSITLVNRSANPKCLKLLYERVMRNSRINYMDNTVCNGIFYDDNILEITLSSANKEIRLKPDYIVFAIGRVADTDFINIEESELETLITNKRLFFIGDIKNGIYRQTSIAIADGIKASMEIFEITKQS